jgi:hypothetical protein
VKIRIIEYITNVINITMYPFTIPKMFIEIAITTIIATNATM